MNNKHHMIYYLRGTGTYVTSAPRARACEKQHRFPGRDFNSDHPISNEVEKYLVTNHKFTLVGDDEHLVTLVYNHAPNLN